MIKLFDFIHRFLIDSLVCRFC